MQNEAPAVTGYAIRIQAKAIIMRMLFKKKFIPNDVVNRMKAWMRDRRMNLQEQLIFSSALVETLTESERRLRQVRQKIQEIYGGEDGR